MGAGLLEPGRVINPVQQRPQSDELFAIEFGFATANPSHADVACRRHRRSRDSFSHLIRPRKSDQAGIDGVGEYRGQHRVPESQRR